VRRSTRARKPSRASLAAVALGALLAVSLAACGGTPILANPPLVVAGPPTATPRASNPPDPVPIAFPRDDGPHDRLTEWWYDTGHLSTSDGRHFGFEFVIFRAERGDVPVTWASHLALTDESSNRFVYAQRSQIGPAVDRSPHDAAGSPTGYDLAIAGQDPQDPTAPVGSPWAMAGSGGRDHLTAALSPVEAAGTGLPFGLDLALTPLKPPALHDTVGWVPFGPAGGSYYYSRTRLDLTGSLQLGGALPMAVTGEAWFDHQWGDFVSVGGGGWDWFAMNLADGTDLTLSLVRAADGTYPIVYGTLVAPSGSAAHLDASSFTVTATGSWTSAKTAATYPAGWRIDVPAHELSISLAPTVADQELDTRATTGVVYWEGSQHVAATVAGQAVGGEAYVELTGYAPSAPTPSPSPPD
jgi:predicted secreted hydrolase